jgi:hypothetical protein
MRHVAFLLAMFSVTAHAQVIDRFDREYITQIGTGGGTFYGAICWYASTQSVCIDSPADGDFQIYGSGGTNNEDLTIDTETVANVLGLSSSTGVTDIDLGTLQLLFGVGATLKPGSTDDVLCLEESGTATDQFCMKTDSDAVTFYQGDEATTANITGNTIAGRYLSAALATGGVLTLDDTTAPGVNDAIMGTVYFRSADDASNNTYYAQIEGYTDEVTDGDEDGKVLHKIMENGSMTTFLELTADDTYPEVAVYKNLTIGTGGQWAQGSTDDVICLQERDTAADQFCMQTTGDAVAFLQGDESTRSTAYTGSLLSNGQIQSSKTDGGAVNLIDSTSPGVNDAISGSVKFYSYDNAGTPALTVTAQIDGYLEEKTDTDEDGSLLQRVMNNGSMTTVQTIDATDGVEAVSFAWPLIVGGASDPADSGVIRLDNGASICAESNTPGTDRCVSVNASDLWAFTAGLSVSGAIYSSTLYSSDGLWSQTSSGGVVVLDDTTATGVNDALAGVVYFRSADDGSTNTYYAQIEAYTEEVTDGDEDGSLLSRVMNNGSMTTVQTIDATDGVEAVTFAWPLIVGGASDPADGGVIRLDNADSICWEADPAGTDECITFTSGEELSVTGPIAAAGSVHIPAGSSFYWDSRALLSSPADGQVTGKQNDSSTGATLDFLTADTLTVKDQAGTGSGHLIASGSITTSGLLSAGNHQAAASNTFYWVGRTELYSDEDGQLQIEQSDNTVGVTLDANDVADTLTVKDQAGTGSGSVSFGGALTMSGVVNPGDSNYTTIATSNWIAMATLCTASRTITLDDDHCVTGRVITITDAGCGAAANNIIVDPEGTSLIQGAAGTFTMSTDDESIDVGCVDGSGGAGAKKWWVR